MGEFCLLVELHLEGSAPAAWAAGLLGNDEVCKMVEIQHMTG
jgi:hypothetical protein